jgi:N-acetylglucosamine kinase-like BadF-type ATPase
VLWCAVVCCGVLCVLQVAEMFEVDLPITDIINSSSSSEGPAAAAAAAASAVSAAAGGGDSAAAAVLLRDVSYLDTAVTVVDAHHMLAHLHSIHTFRVRTQLGF